MFMHQGWLGIYALRYYSILYKFASAPRRPAREHWGRPGLQRESFPARGGAGEQSADKHGENFVESFAVKR